MQKQRLTQLGHRSGLEDKIALQLQAHNIPYSYEEHKLKYEQPAKVRSYLPDFIIDNGIVVETKGRFLTADRQKHLLITKQYPTLDLRFVFSNPRNRISKQSKTTYGDWCEKNGFLYAARTIPTDWLDEPAEPARVKAAKDILGWKPPRRRRRRKRASN